MKITTNSLTTKNGTLITIEEVKGHLKVRIKGVMFDKPFQVTAMTSVRSKLNVFEKKAVLVHFYKLVDKKNSQGSSSKTLKNYLRHTNYAEVFGSQWN